MRKKGKKIKNKKEGKKRKEGTKENQLRVR
jgi:hypothetical protein